MTGQHSDAAPMLRLADSDAADRALPVAWSTSAGAFLRSFGQRLHPQKRLNLALQGGGAHGAVSWGVSDRLLEDGRFQVESISGASAGAVNAAVLAYGIHKGGPEAAREHLEGLWV